MILSEVQQRFILHWGEKAPRFGFNRTVSQIHALLFLSREPLDADEIAETLKISRSNVSISIRELESWGLVKISPRMGERKAYYETLDSIWEMFQLMAIERQKREMAHSISILRELLLTQPSSDTEEDQYVSHQVESVLQFFEQAANLTELMRKLSAEQAEHLLQAGLAVLEQVNQNASPVIPPVSE